LTCRGLRTIVVSRVVLLLYVVSRVVLLLRSPASQTFATLLWVHAHFRRHRYIAYCHAAAAQQLQELAFQGHHRSCFTPEAPPDSRHAHASGESKYGAYPNRDVEAGHDSALGTPGAAHTPGSGYNNGVGATGSPGYGTTPTATGYGTTPTATGYGAADPALAAPANVPEAVPGQKRRGGFLGLTSMGKKGGAEEARATGAPSAPPAPAAGAYEQPPGGAASAWSSAGHGLSGTPAT
jgi:hypothetical protein